MKDKVKDKIDRILEIARKRTAFDRAILTLQCAKRDILARRADIGVGPSYAKNRMGCVTVEIDAAIKGLRRDRGNASRALARIGKRTK